MLNDIRILDFTRLLPGPLATHLLSHMGAEVIKVESPKRMDYVRHYGPPIDGASRPFHCLNHLKELWNIDYETETGREEILQKVSGVDVLIEQFRPGAMQGWGLGYKAVKAIKPDIVYVSLTGYGHTNGKASEAGHDLNYMATAGLLSLSKDDQGKPIIPGYQLGDIGGGSYATIMAIQAGLIQKLQTGKGCHLDVGMTPGLLPFLSIPMILEWGGMKHEMFSTINGKTMVNYSVYPCADGKWLALGALEVKFWNNLCDCVGKPDWKRKHDMELSVHQFPKAEVEALFLQKTREEWLTLFKGKDVCVSPVHELNELEQQNYFQEIKAFKSFKTAQGTELQTLGTPFQIIE